MLVRTANAIADQERQHAGILTQAIEDLGGTANRPKPTDDTRVVCVPSAWSITLRAMEGGASPNRPGSTTTTRRG